MSKLGVHPTAAESAAAFVQVVYHPETALEAARSQIPDIVFLDIGLPSMDGYELASSVTKWDHY